MSNLYVSGQYKHTVIDLLYRNDNFIKLIDPTPSECPDLDIYDVLTGGEWIIDGEVWYEQGYVFDYNFVDDTTTDEKTFVFVETDIDTVTDKIFTGFNLYVCIFSTKRLIRLTECSTPTAQEVADMGYFATSTYGNRIDALCDCVDSTLNGYSGMPSIGEVTPATRNYMTTYMPNTKYYGKCLKYNITGFNAGGDYCGI